LKKKFFFPCIVPFQKLFPFNKKKIRKQGEKFEKSDFFSCHEKAWLWIRLWNIRILDSGSLDMQKEHYRKKKIHMRVMRRSY